MTDSEPEKRDGESDRNKVAFGGSIVGALLIGLILGVALGGGPLAGTASDDVGGDASTPEMEVLDTEFEHVSNQALPEANVSVSFDDSTNTVEFEGVVVAGSCDLTKLGSVEYDAADDRAVINVVTTPDTDAEVCTMEITGAEYEGEVELSARPGTVEVRHNGETIEEFSTQS